MMKEPFGKAMRPITSIQLNHVDIIEEWVWGQGIEQIFDHI